MGQIAKGLERVTSVISRAQSRESGALHLNRVSSSRLGPYLVTFREGSGIYRRGLALEAFGGKIPLGTLFFRDLVSGARL